MTITEYLEKQPKPLLFILGILLLAFVAAGDYLTQGLEFSPFYLVPVSFFSWFIGRRTGILAASLSVILIAHFRPVPGAVGYWDASVWFALYTGSTLMISQLKGLYERERHLSRIDPLTMAKNRRAFLESAIWAKSFSERHNAPLSIAYVDLDDFKQLNDRMGHTTGDKVLVVVAGGLRRALRPTDVVARIGGDEFAILLPETDAESAGQIMARVRIDLDRAMHERSWPVTFSVGLVSFSPPIVSLPDMIQAADEAMYAAKNNGKNRLEQRKTALSSKPDTVELT